MSSRILAALALVAVAGCGNLPVTGDGIVAIEVTLPISLALKQGETRQMEARAFNASGDEVAADIRWYTGDATIAVDETGGLVTALAESGIGRVQARTGTLRSDIITFTLQPAPVGDDDDNGGDGGGGGDDDGDGEGEQEDP